MILWYWRRLRAMGLREITHRGRRALQQRAERKHFESGTLTAVLGPTPDSTEFLEGGPNSPWLFTAAEVRDRAKRVPPTWRERTVAEAEEILAGTYRWLGRSRDCGERPQWTRDAVSGMDFPQVHWTRLSASDPDGRFDMKHVWEPNLHGAFVTLAKAFLLGDDRRHRDHLVQIWTDWLDQNPPLGGPNYLAPVETGLRLVHWAAALRFWWAREAPPKDLASRVWGHAHVQRTHIARNLSLHSSANNHLLGELATLALVDLAFPGLATATETARWIEQCREQVLLQFAPDGGNREQALHYHGFSLALALLVEQAAGAVAAAHHPEVHGRLGAAARFLDSAMDRRRVPFLFGDSDESEVLPLAEGPRPLYEPILRHADSLLRVPSADGAVDERTFWLTGADPRPPETATAHGIRRFPESGHAFLACGDWDGHLNAGGLGYLSIAAHGHADALSVQLRYCGIPVVLDPGTFTYRGGNRWREHLVSAAAHSSILVDGQEPARRLGPFLWGRGYRCRLDPVAGGVASEAQPPGSTCASGSLSLGAGLTLVREIELSEEGAEIRDRLEGRGRHRVRLHWLLGGSVASGPPDGLRVQTEAGPLQLRVDGLEGEPTLHVGDETSPGSPCFSSGYDALTSAHSAVWEATVDAPAGWVTRFRTGP